MPENARSINAYNRNLRRLRDDSQDATFEELCCGLAPHPLTPDEMSRLILLAGYGHEAYSAGVQEMPLNPYDTALLASVIGKLNDVKHVGEFKDGTIIYYDDWELIPVPEMQFITVADAKDASLPRAASYEPEDDECLWLVLHLRGQPEMDVVELIDKLRQILGEDPSPEEQGVIDDIEDRLTDIIDPGSPDLTSAIIDFIDGLTDISDPPTITDIIDNIKGIIDVHPPGQAGPGPYPPVQTGGYDFGTAQAGIWKYCYKYGETLEYTPAFASGSPAGAVQVLPGAIVPAFNSHLDIRTLIDIAISKHFGPYYLRRRLVWVTLAVFTRTATRTKVGLTEVNIPEHFKVWLDTAHMAGNLVANWDYPTQQALAGTITVNGFPVEVELDIAKRDYQEITIGNSFGPIKCAPMEYDYSLAVPPLTFQPLIEGIIEAGIVHKLLLRCFGVKPPFLGDVDPPYTRIFDANDGDIENTEHWYFVQRPDQASQEWQGFFFALKNTSVGGFDKTDVYLEPSTVYTIQMKALKDIGNTTWTVTAKDGADNVVAVSNTVVVGGASTPKQQFLITNPSVTLTTPADWDACEPLRLANTVGPFLGFNYYTITGP